MSILYYDCFAGISGDMNLAAMIGLGVDPERLRAELSKLGLDHEFELRVSREARNGIHGVRVDVRLTADETPPPVEACGEQGAIRAAGSGPDPEQDHDSLGHGHDQGSLCPGHTHGHGQDGHVHQHSHGHGQDSHVHAHVHAHAHAHGHTHAHGHGHDGPDHGPGQSQGGHAHQRNLADIEAIIQGSALDEAVKQTSLAIFRKVAEAESKVHGKALKEVHFHEVGATDSIVDIVGAAICRHWLGVDAVWSSSVELGGGVVRCAHGLIPVPAPATTEILQGIPTTRGATRHEATTPTGAAILAALAETFTDAPALILEKTAYGIGHRETEFPNVLRVHLARPVASRVPVREARLLQCNLDDMTAEALGVAMDVLMENGAMDVHFTPILMKKSRPGTNLSLLCAVKDEERFKELLFRHTTTLGIKSLRVEKTELDRAFTRLETPLGPVTMKHAIRNGAIVRSKPELEDCRELAARHGLSLAEVRAVVDGCAGREEKP
ncbi:MAG: nickel pincer cofactor biosynthesis protein LarC [Acidobacteriota bacterium]